MRSLTLIPLLALALNACAMDDEDFDPADYEVTEEDQAEDDAFTALANDGKADAALTYTAVAKLAKAAGVACTGERIAIAVAVAKAESGFRPDATNTAGNAHGIDRGLWQVNSYWHPEVSKTCALSPSCNARAMYNISKKGTYWKPWWTYVNGKHVPFMSQARGAQNAVCP
jgi:hypothetical protein